MKKMQVQNAKGEVRIIAGLWRGRKLPVLNAEGLRPTGDRVKETLIALRAVAHLVLKPFLVKRNR